MASSIPKEVKKVIVDGFVAEAQWKVALFTTADCLARSTYAACLNEVPNGSGYTTTGAVLADRAAAYVGENVKITATNLAWAASTFTCSHAIVYDTATGLIRARYDLGGTKSVTNGTLTLQWNAAGLLTVS